MGDTNAERQARWRERRAQELADCRKALAEARNAEGDQQLRNALEEVAQVARDELPKTAQKKLDRAVKLAVEAMRMRLQVEFNAKLQEAIAEEKLALQKAREEANAFHAEAEAEYQKALDIRLGIDSHMTQDEFKMILGLLHPDRYPPELQDKANRAFIAFKRLEKTVNDKTPIAALRQRGWDKVSPFYRAEEHAKNRKR